MDQGDDDKRFKCESCGQQFKNHHSLEGHMKGHRGQGNQKDEEKFQEPVIQKKKKPYSANRINAGQSSSRISNPRPPPRLNIPNARRYDDRNAPQASIPVTGMLHPLPGQPHQSNLSMAFIPDMKNTVNLSSPSSYRPPVMCTPIYDKSYPNDSSGNSKQIQPTEEVFDLLSHPPLENIFSAGHSQQFQIENSLPSTPPAVNTDNASTVDPKEFQQQVLNLGPPRVLKADSQNLRPRRDLNLHLKQLFPPESQNLLRVGSEEFEQHPYLNMPTPPRVFKVDSPQLLRRLALTLKQPSPSDDTQNLVRGGSEEFQRQQSDTNPNFRNSSSSDSVNSPTPNRQPADCKRSQKRKRKND